MVSILMLSAVQTILVPNGHIIHTVSHTQPKFSLASWTYPDAHGQGIDRFLIYTNHTGSWVEVGSGYYYHYDTCVLNWTVGWCIKLLCYTYMNGTLTGTSTVAQAKLVQRHSVVVTDGMGQTVFSKQNFTYDDYSPLWEGMWGFTYYVVLNFLPTYGQIYTATVSYEVFW